MNIVKIVLLDDRVKFNITLPVCLTSLFETLLTKNRLIDDRKQKPRNNTKPSGEYAKYKRDVLCIWDNKCAKCGVSGAKERLTIHHLNSFYKYPDLKLHSDNGMPLCLEHHKEFHETYGFKDFSEEDIWDYLGA